MCCWDMGNVTIFRLFQWDVNVGFRKLTIELFVEFFSR